MIFKNQTKVISYKYNSIFISLLFKEKIPSKFDQELFEFEKRLENDCKNTTTKLKPNLSNEWVNELKQKLAKLK